jgi:hypothetical protein
MCRHKNLDFVFFGGNVVKEANKLVELFDS